jgi:hypothetical protein
MEAKRQPRCGHHGDLAEVVDLDSARGEQRLAPVVVSVVEADRRVALGRDVGGERGRASEPLPMLPTFMPSLLPISS